ncbi:MAG: phosphate ABC transporter permease PstA [Acidimicrobiia bacterium]
MIETPPTVELPPMAGVPDEPRRMKTFGRVDAAEIAGAAVSAGAFTWLIFSAIAWNGALGAVLIWYVLFVVLYRAVARSIHGGLVATDRVMTVVLATGAAVAFIPLVMIIWFVVSKGIKDLSTSFFTDTLASVGPQDAGGGAFHSIVGTLEQVGLASLVAIPLAILTAIYLNEVKGRMARGVRFVVDSMSGLPSIVAGLFVYSFWVVELGKGFSGMAGSMALIVLFIPTVTRASEEMLRIVPDSLREASLALGAPQWKTVARVVLPTARSGLVSAAILGVARAIGETAPMVLTVLGSSSLNWNVFHANQDDLPLFILKLIRSPNNAQVSRAWTGALVLVVLVLFLFTLARILGRGRKKGIR